MQSYKKRDRNDLGIQMSRKMMARKRRRTRIRVVSQMKTRTECTQVEGRDLAYYHLARQIFRIMMNESYDMRSLLICFNTW
jgi:hypothetical protein